MNKTKLRQKYKGLRQKLKQNQVEDFSISIANKLLQLDIWDHNFYHIFLPIETQKEVNTEYVLNILLGKDKSIVISKSNFKNYTLTHFLLTDSTTLKVNTYGIPEPVDGIEIQTQQLDVVFIPLLAFDLKGNRVGYGKGFYDRFLSDCNLKALKIGLSFFEAEAEILDSNAHDIPLDFCVTPATTYKF